MIVQRIYLAGPYSHALDEVRQERFEALTVEAARLMALGHQVYSPITHGHVLAKAGDLPTSWRYWEETCKGFILDWADQMAVLTLDGWRESVGVTAEMRLARMCGKPIFFLMQHVKEALS